MNQGSFKVIESENRNFVERLLEGKSEDFKAKVLEYVHSSGLSIADPDFVVLLAISILTGVLVEKPQQLRRMFAEWRSSIEQILSLVEVKIFEQQKTAVMGAIAQAASDLIRERMQAREKQFERMARSHFSPLWQLTLVVTAGAAVLVVGFVAGMTVPGALGGGYVEGRKLTVKEAKLIDWAVSEEGKQARNLIEWNRDYLQACEQDAENLGVKLTFGGRRATEGFCVLWTQPPSQRSFERE